MQAYAAKQRIKEGKQAINWTRLSCKGKAQNEVRLQLHALAYNLGVFLQKADLPEEMADWSLTSLQTRLIKIGARVVRHARAITFQLAEVAVSGDLFHRILTAIHGLRAPPASTWRYYQPKSNERGFTDLTKRVPNKYKTTLPTSQRPKIALRPCV
jgi:hypothetical protein